jgi:hypothetical protein
MQLREMAPIRFLVRALPFRLDKKTLGITAALVVSVLFGDVIFPLLGHLLFLLLEFTGQESEDLLELLFGFSTRQSQILLIWVVVPILLFALWRIMQRPLAALHARWNAFWNWINSEWSHEDWFRVLFLLAFLIGTLFFLL